MRRILLQIIPPVLFIREMRYETVRESALFPHTLISHYPRIVLISYTSRELERGVEIGRDGVFNYLVSLGRIISAT